MSCDPRVRLRPSGRPGVLLLGLVVAAYLALIAHTALHSPIAQDAGCVFCSYGDQPTATQADATPPTVGPDPHTAQPLHQWRFASPGYRRCARGPPQRI